MISKRSVKLFQKVASQVPAYGSFLESQGCNRSAIRSPESFKRLVPLTSKKTYLVVNKPETLMWGASLDAPLLYCSTSGSTGEPYYFPRNEKLSWQYSFLIEDFLKQSSYGAGRTLVLIGFGMGVWIGGVITLRAFEVAVQRMKAPVAILPTGYNKAEIFKALKRLAPNFDQTVIVGYPPFVKELVDDSPSEGVELATLHVRFLFAAEAFTESFRSYVCEAAGIKDPLRDTLNIYGTADIGAMAYETPLSILIRRLVLEKGPSVCKAVFQQTEKTPTLAQYNPEFIEFEEVNGEIVLTGDGALPLVRYAIGDHGGVLDYRRIKELLEQNGIDLEREISIARIGDLANRRQPFVYVYERKDLAATLQGMIIYPEFIKEALIKKDLRPYFTQRFSMSTQQDKHQNQYLQINVELRKGIKPSKILQQMALKSIHITMIRKSSEFAEVSRERDTTKLLDVILWPNGHAKYFSPGTKQKWVEKA